MKVYVDELPKDCKKCAFCEYFGKDAQGKGKHEVACYFNGSLGNILYGNQTSPKTCPLQSLADHDKKVRADVVAENQAHKARWEKLKEFIEEHLQYDKEELSTEKNLPNRFYITAEKMILEKMQELEE